MHLGIGAGDEVIVPAETHVATAHAVEITGARPVFVDCEAATGNIDPAAVENALTGRTRAISVVHYLGLPVDMAKIGALASNRGIFVVEDCALAVEASYGGKACGLLGDVGVFSFYPVKHLTTAEGGMVVSKHASVVSSIENIKAFGYDRSPSERKIPGVYDVARLGLNYRMNEIGAAIGLEQLRKVGDFQRRRVANARVLRAGLAGIGEIAVLSDGDAQRVHGNYCIVAVLEKRLEKRRPEIIESMKARGVGTSVYYPVPIPLSAYYSKKYGYKTEMFPNAARISYRGIALPVGPHLVEEDMEYICNSLKSAIGELSK
jgi:dTDP-4-amino-4,6-dideoxygalactose transaminase